MDPLVGDSFWAALNGFHDSKNNGVQYPDMFNQLLVSLSCKAANKISDLRYTDDERDRLIEDFEKEIPGSTGRAGDKYYKDDLTSTAATIVEQDAALNLSRQVNVR